MKESLKKYSVIIFLSFLVIVLIFLKIMYGNIDKKNESMKIIPTPTIIYPDPKTVTLEDLKKMDDEARKNYLNQLTEEEINNLPEEVPIWDDKPLPTINYIEVH